MSNIISQMLAQFFLSIHFFKCYEGIKAEERFFFLVTLLLGYQEFQKTLCKNLLLLSKVSSILTQSYAKMGEKTLFFQLEQLNIMFLLN